MLLTNFSFLQDVVKVNTVLHELVGHIHPAPVGASILAVLILLYKQFKSHNVTCMNFPGVKIF